MALRCKRFRGGGDCLPKVSALVVLVIGGFLAAFPFSTSSAQGCFIRGDFDGNGVVDAADYNDLLSFTFNGFPVPFCVDAADINDDGSITGTDVISLNLFLNAGGGPPAAPFPVCGFDPTPDGLTCLNVRGDLSYDGLFTPVDVVIELGCVFGAGICGCTADVNCVGGATPADVVLELLWVFTGAPLPACPCP